MGEWVYSSTIFDLGTRWRWVVSFTPCHFTTGEIAPCNNWVRGWVDPRASLDAVGGRKILSCKDSNPGRLTRSPSLYRLRYPSSTSSSIHYRNHYYIIITPSWYPPDSKPGTQVYNSVHTPNNAHCDSVRKTSMLILISGRIISNA
jgi:hypothetical protein